MISRLSTEDDIRTVSLFGKGKLGPEIREYLSRLGLGLVDIEIAKEDFDESTFPTDMPESLRKELINKLKGSHTYKVNARHNIYNKNGEPTTKQLL